MFRINVTLGVVVAVACAAWAQEEGGEGLTIIATGLGESTEVSPDVPVAERRPVVAAAWEHLGNMVQRKADGSAKALHRTGSSERWVEWKNLRIVGVSEVGVSEAEIRQGITRRYHCEIASDSYRVWLPELISWSEWRPGRYGRFPWKVEVCWVGGEWIASADCQDSEFIAPGGGGSSSGGHGLFRIGSDGSETRVAMR
jgi:hypothetical protein